MTRLGWGAGHRGIGAARCRPGRQVGAVARPGGGPVHPGHGRGRLRRALAPAPVGAGRRASPGRKRAARHRCGPGHQPVMAGAERSGDRAAPRGDRLPGRAPQPGQGRDEPAHLPSPHFAARHLQRGPGGDTQGRPFRPVPPGHGPGRTAGHLRPPQGAVARGRCPRGRLKTWRARRATRRPRAV